MKNKAQIKIQLPPLNPAQASLLADFADMILSAVWEAYADAIIDFENSTDLQMPEDQDCLDYHDALNTLEDPPC